MISDLHARVEDTHWWFTGRRDIMRRLVDRVAPPGRTVVDIGCGTGANIAALQGQYPVLGVDTSADALRHARQHFPAVRFSEGTAETVLPAIGATVGCVLLMDVLEHVPDDFALLAAVLAPLRAGSQIFVTVPADMRLWSGHDIAFQHYRRYDPARLEAIWAEQPVRLRLLSHFCSRLYWPIRAIRAFRRRFSPASQAARSDLSTPPSLLNQPLRRLFAAEGRRLSAALDRGVRPFAHGSSLVAVIERAEGTVQTQGKPAGLAPDPHDPWPGRAR